MNLLKKFNSNISQGLVILIPISISVWALYNISVWLGYFTASIFTFIDPQYGLIFALSMLFVFGIITNTFNKMVIFQAFKKSIEKNMPILYSIYTAICTLIDSILKNSNDQDSKLLSATFKFPRPEAYSVGFITNSTVIESVKKFLPLKDPVTILAPTSPNPLTGFVGFTERENTNCYEKISNDGILSVLTSMGSYNLDTSREHASNQKSQEKLSKIYSIFKYIGLNILSGIINAITISIIIYGVKLIFKLCYYIFSSMLIVTSNPYLSLLISIASICLSGILCRYIIFKKIIEYLDYLIDCMPVINMLYKTSKSISEGLFKNDKSSEKSSSCVIIKYPSEQVYTLGIVTNKYSKMVDGYSHIFIPTTPNPTSGYLALIKTSDLIYTDLRSYDCAKIILSCGM